MTEVSQLHACYCLCSLQACLVLHARVESLYYIWLYILHNQSFAIQQVDDGIKYGMIEAISHLIHRDYDAIVHVS